MRKLLFIAFAFLFTFAVSAQKEKDRSKFGSCFELLSGDSLLVYFNCTGSVIDKRCASYYRIGLIDSTNISVVGKFTDYFMNEKKALEATIKNAKLEGKATYYFESGKIRSTGKYRLNRKTGIWKHYYENGELQTVINYVDGTAFISEYRNSRGKRKVENANGKYKGEFYPYKQCSPITIWGEVKNGKMQGKWVLYNSYFKRTIGNEYFDNGVFIKGVSGEYSYTDQSKINIDDFSSHENLSLIDSHLGCPGDRISSQQYKNDAYYKFYKELMDTMSLDTSLCKNDQWLIIRLEINTNNKLGQVFVRSSVHDTQLVNKIKEIIETKNFFHSVLLNGKPINFYHTFTALINNNQFIIPKKVLWGNF